MSQQALREMTFQNVLNNDNVADLPIVFTGTPEECAEYAKERGFHWRDSAKMLFGGWWYIKPVKGEHEGLCLMPDIAPKQSKRRNCKLVTN